MKNDTIITLENGMEYILLENVLYCNKKYFMAVGYDRNSNKTNSDYKFFKEDNINNEIYVVEVTDEKVLKILITLFSVDFIDMVEEDII